MSFPLVSTQRDNCTDLYSVTDCFLRVLDFCDWTTLVAVSHADKSGRDCVRRVFRGRVQRVIGRLLKSWQCKAIFNHLDVTGAMISGPIPWAIMTIEMATPNDNLPTEIKIVTPAHTFQSWITVLQYIGFCTVSGSRVPNMPVTVSKARRFWAPSQNISIFIIESCSSSILSAVLALPFTSDMTLLSTSRLFCFYPSLVDMNVTLSGFRYTPDEDIKWWTSRGVRHFYSTYEWDGPCGSACPALWRHTEGLHGVGEFAWGGLFNDKDIEGNMGNSAMLSKAQFKWRIGVCCVNRFCQFRTRYF
ncbi:hypothetical protein Hypma_002442 [Hypsizygus marmoreus]|uniref:Uncharacterized protein n=1 Tax=Hypsizygus marmoreus TaxID=39966 RepID=A0A369J4I1_HYPMA|nr:hypothetical protein Hypma_002442 [Hypsizygus marmoreus]